MKKTFSLLALTLALVSCNNASESKAFKTAYVDTSKMMEEYTEAKDLQAKYNTKSQEMGKELEAEMRRFEQERNAFSEKARQLGEIWAQQNSAPLVRKQQQLQMAQEQLMRQIQNESGTEMDSVVSKVKKFIKDYGKKEGYDYIFGTGEAVSILYSQDQYDITKEVTKALNDEYAKGTGAKPVDAKTETKAADTTKAEATK